MSAVASSYQWEYLIEKIGLTYSFWWRFVVPEVIRIKGYKCEYCGTTKGKMDVHHTSYDVQTINTLKVACRKCHKRKHQEGVTALKEYLYSKANCKQCKEAKK